MNTTTQNRLSREVESRSSTQRVQSWQPASLLPEPKKEPGYSYRWVRIAAGGKSDPTNVSAKFREGWEPVRIEEQPDFAVFNDPDRSDRFKDNIEVGGLVLCKIPNEFMKQRREFFENKTQSQMESVDNNFMRENDPRMPLFRERKTTTSFGKGKL